MPHFRGASTHVYEVAKNLVACGNEVHVVSRRVSIFQPKYEVLDGIHIHRIYRGIARPLPFSSYEHLMSGGDQPKLASRFYEWYLFNIFSLYSGIISAQIVRRHNIDVILERETSFGAGAIASILTRRPVVLEITGPRYNRLSFKVAKSALAYTHLMIHDASSEKAKVILVDAAADTDLFKPDRKAGQAVRKKYGLEKAVVVGYVGTFPEWHGIQELIEASVEVLEMYPSVRFIMVGPYFEWAKIFAEKLRVINSFIFVGPVPYSEVGKYVNAADILVAPYNPLKSEIRRKFGIGSPLKVFEYMACGKPVITTAVEPINRVIDDGRTGILVPAGNSKALADAIISLIRDPEMAEKIGMAARMEVEEKYSWRVFTRQLVDILKQAVEN
ncbi:MAG: glycosyltransferase family 4 protein [Candidatus Bathyarchaeia archaeon]